MSPASTEKVTLLLIDVQYDFTRPGGTCYAPRSSVRFIVEELVPFIREHNVRAFEIVSDYRQPRRGDPRNCCRPGEWGFSSEVPEDVLSGPRWTKSMNSPIWTRDGIGDPDVIPGEPYQDPASFDRWLLSSVGTPAGPVVLAGLSLDACLLCSAQELTFRGYDVRILREGTDTRSGRSEERDRLIMSPPVIFWSRPIGFSDLMGLKVI